MTQLITGKTLLSKSVAKALVIVTIVLAMLLTGLSPSSAAGTPYTTIVSVIKNVSVTISGVNFPAAQTFTVRMGAYGTLGIGGTVVGTKDPSSSTSFSATYNIPASLVGASKIAIRFDSPQGYYAFDWFVNDATAPVATATPGGSTPTPGPTPTPKPTGVPGYTSIPTFSITEVLKGTSVSILTKNFPAGQTFTVRMGEFGTLGIGGTVVGTLNSGAGGAISQTFTIPAALAARTQIAIRLDSNLGYYSYNWFWNNVNYGSNITPTVTPAVTATPGPTATATVAPAKGYVGIPTFSITSVVKDSSVTISAVNFPPDQTFTVRMGEFGTLGVGGTIITTYTSGTGGNFSATYTIPAALAGRAQIAIRLESATGYYYAYNWFYNN